jgi:general secretion pathway protein I
MKPSAGFTLIEVLIALVIISIAFTAILISSSQSIRNTKYLEDKMTAGWVGSDIMNKIQVGLIKLPETDALHSKTEMLDHGWFWDASLQSTHQPTIKKIVVTVSASEKGDKLIEIVSYAPSSKESFNDF